MKLEEIVMVNLYEVKEQGYSEEPDSPVSGMSEIYNKWEKEYGLYATRIAAERVQGMLIEKWIRKGYHLISLPSTLRNIEKHISISISHVIVPKIELVKNLNDTHAWKGKAIKE